MRLDELSEWCIIRTVQPHLVTAVASVLQDLAPHTDDMSMNHKHTLTFLLCELQTLSLSVCGDRNLSESIAISIKAKACGLLQLFEKLLGSKFRYRLSEVKQQDQDAEVPHLPGISLCQIKSFLYDKDKCDSAVSTFESFNQFMEGLFLPHQRHETSTLDQTQKSSFEFNSRHQILTEELLGNIQNQLVACASPAMHKILLQVAREAWQAAQQRSRSLCISSCRTPELWQQITYIRTDSVVDNCRDFRCEKLSNLCDCILESLDFREVLNLHAVDETLYRFIPLRGHAQQRPQPVSAMSIGKMIESEYFSPLSSKGALRASHGLTVPEKREITLSLSWCLVHLFDCDWTNNCWSVDKIFLLAALDERENWLHAAPPYITCEHTDAPSTTCPPESAVVGTSIFLHFARLLVEIDTGCKIVTMETTREGQASLWLTIEKTIQEPQMQCSGHSYLSAIDGCLDLHRRTYHWSLEERVALRQLIYDHIISHLELDFNNYRRPAQKRRRFEPEEHEIPQENRKKRSLRVELRAKEAAEPCLPSNELSGDGSEYATSATGQINAGVVTRKRAKMVILTPIKEALRRSQRIATQQPGHNASESLCSSNPRQTRPGSRNTHRNSTTQTEKKQLEIFDDFTTELHDGGAVAASKQFFQNLDVFLESYVLTTPDPSITVDKAGEISRRARVCVIDTGIDMGYPSVQAAKICGRLKGLRSWKGNRLSVDDQYGHGTHVADLILRGAPEADLYVAKVSDTKYMTQEETESIVQAVEWALDQDVDIISMSFGLDNRNENLERVLNRAAMSGVILMAAAGNHGNNWPRAFPATNRNVICIHASDGKGKDGRISPAAVPHDDNFMTLGTAIPLIWRSGEVVKSGTSFATPIAASIAANVLEIARRTIPMSAQQERRLYSSEGMRQIFRLLSPASDGGYRHVVPWSLWSKRNREGKIREDFLATLDE